MRDGWRGQKRFSVQETADREAFAAEMGFDFTAFAGVAKNDMNGRRVLPYRRLRNGNLATKVRHCVILFAV